MYGDVVTIPQAIIVCVFSIAVVFFVLYLLSVLINVVAAIINAAQKKSAPAPATATKAAPAPVETVTETAKPEDDGALTAVIAAAIAAATGKSASSFVIKSIRPLNQDSEWGRISRSSSLR